MTPLKLIALLAGCLLSACSPAPEQKSTVQAKAVQANVLVAALTPQCVNPMTPNCRFYSECMEATCKCGYSSSGYALSYGKKYCERFLAESAFTAKGKAWRDSTLRCLQEEQVRKLPTNPSACNCAQLRKDAYAAHVGCYTKAGASICDLPPSDILVIDKVVDSSDATDLEGLKALRDVASICIAANPSNAWKQAAAVIQKKISQIGQ